MLNIKIMRLPHSEGLPLPEYKTAGAAGMDLNAALDVSIVLPPGGLYSVPLGFRAALPAGYEAQIRTRSGLAMHGIVVANAPGTIDEDYRGEWKVILANISNTSKTINRGDRIAQAVISKITRLGMNQVEVLDETARGEAGFGSTGV